MAALSAYFASSLALLVFWCFYVRYVSAHGE